jgi:Xaa-Pro aminopeptidase
VFHTSGCLIITHIPIRDRLAFSVTTAAGRQCLVVCKIEESLCREDSWVEDIRTYVEFKELPTTLLARTLAELGLEHQTVGLELGYLREWYARELLAAAPTIRFVPCDDLLEELRMVKPADQVARMEAAATGAGEAVQTVLGEPCVGLTERELRRRFRRALAAHGADGSYVVVASGLHTLVSDHRATDRQIANGEPLLLDAAVTYDGYAAEIATSVIAGAGTAPGAVAVLARTHEAVTAALRPGVAGRDVFARAVATADGALLGQCVGWGVSFGGQERPFLAPESSDVLRPGMTIAVDVQCRVGRDGALRTKRMWVVSESGARELSQRR